MLDKNNLEIGDIVTLTTDEWAGCIGIVSHPVHESQAGHVLVYSAGHILGVPASLDDVVPADKRAEGHVQLAYTLIKLGSHVIEHGLL